MGGFCGSGACRLEQGPVTDGWDGGLTRDEDQAVFSEIFDAAPVPQATIGADATFTHVNRAACEMLGYREDEMVGQAFALVVGDDSMVSATDAFLRLLSRDVDTLRIEATLQRKDGTTLQTEVFGAPVLGAHDQPIYFVVLALDITERRKAEHRIRLKALHDNLTELPNRVWFAERLVQAVARLEREATQLAVFFIDLDGFKAVNDRFGHMVGDEALFVAAGRIRATVRPADTVARHGGDEFTILCEDLASEADAVEIAERIIHVFDTPCRLSGGTVNLRASIGVAFAAGPTTPASLIAEADKAMYSSKAAGKATYRLVAASASRAAAPPRD